MADCGLKQSVAQNAHYANMNLTQSVPIESQYIEFQCPTSPVKMSDLINKHFNSYEIVQNWRNEDGCNRKTKGYSSTQLFDIDNTVFIIIILKQIGHLQERSGPKNTCSLKCLSKHVHIDQ